MSPEWTKRCEASVSIKTLLHMSKYEHGYLPKIAYHLFKQNDAKVEYFTKRQIERYGKVTDDQRWWLLEEIHRLTEQAH